MMNITNKLRPYWLLLRIDRPIGFLLLLWPTLWALWIASNGAPNLKILLVFIAGVIVMRAAGCVINDFADRHIDGHVARTQQRPLPAGLISQQQAIGVFLLLCAIALGLVLMLNTFTLLLSLAGLGLAVLYPFMKRFTHWPQFVLGLAFSWGIPMAFSAVTQHVPMIAWLLFAANVFWTIAYDTQYAMADRADDIRIGVKSTAILFGPFDRLIIGCLQLSALTLLVIVGQLQQFSLSYFIGIMIAAGFAIYQQYLIWQRDPALCFQAFLNNHWFGLAIFLGIFLAI